MNRPNDRFGFNPNLMTDLGLNAIVLEKADIGRTDLLFLMFALFKDNCFFLFFSFCFSSCFLASLFSFPFLAFLFLASLHCLFHAMIIPITAE